MGTEEISKIHMETNSLKNEVIRAQDILKQIHMRFAAKYKINSNILGEIRAYKEKLECMEDERVQSLIEIEKHLSVIDKTNEELQQRLVNEENFLHNADENINDLTAKHLQSDQTAAKNIADFSDALTLQLGDSLSKGMTAVSPPGSSNLEKYLQDLYEELCIRVQAQQDQVNTKEPGIKLLEIKALLDEGEKRLKMLSVKMEGDVTKDTTTPTAVDADQTANRQVRSEHSIQNGFLKTEEIIPSPISSPQPQQVNDQKTEVQLNPRPPPVQDGWVKETQTTTPSPNPATDSFLSDDKSLKDSGKSPLSEDSQKISSTFSKPIGPVQASSFAIQTGMTVDSESRHLGKGRDYFEEMFQNAQEYFSHSHDHRIGRSHVSKPTTPPLINGYNATTSRDVIELDQSEPPVGVRQKNTDFKEVKCNTRLSSDWGLKCVNVGKVHAAQGQLTFETGPQGGKFWANAIGSLCILEINEDGKFVRIYNANRKEAEIGNYIIKQNVGGHPVIVFRFPPRTKFPQNSIITVWAASCDNDIFHDPPSNYIWESQVKWGVGPEFTTILCKPNGQAIAWTNAAHRYNPYLSPRIPMTPIHLRTMKRSPSDSHVETRSCSRNDIAFEVRNSSRTWEKNLVFLERRKRSAIPAACIKHPHGRSPGSPAHPCGGKDNEVLKSHTPEPIKSVRMVIPKRCSNANEGHTIDEPTNQTSSKNKNNSSKKQSKKPEFDLMSRVAFMKPSTRLQYGLELIRAQYDMTYNPPMPKLSRAVW